MPEYLAPGVYIEETSYRSKSIEGVSTTTTGFIGPTRYGPVDLEPDIITSLDQFERSYGDGERLVFGELKMDNFMWHAARAFFIEGGKRLYISRVFRPLDAEESGKQQDGYARKKVGRVEFRARYPGEQGNFRIRVTAKSGNNVVGRVRDTASSDPKATVPTLGSLSDRDVVWVRDVASTSPSPPLSPPQDVGDVYLLQRDANEQPFPWAFRGASGSAIASPLSSAKSFSELIPDPEPGQGDSVRVITLTLELRDVNDLPLTTWINLPIDPEHRTDGLADSVFALFADDPEARNLPIVVTAETGMTGLDVLESLFSESDLADGDALVKGVPRTGEIRLEGGNDGKRPGMREYEGTEVEPASPPGARPYKTGLKQLEALEDISIIAAPGTTWNYSGDFRDEANAIIGLLLAHARSMSYRIAVIDSAQNQSISDVRKMRSKLDSKYGALYFPWVRVFDPITRRPITLPPSGFVAGIYARNDVERAVFKAPANEVVNLSIGFEMLLSKPQQEVLNPEGINCFRFFEGRGMLLWGARTLSSDQEWKYVNLRRYFVYVEHSIDRGTQWAVFEPNGERLWANVRRTIEDFLLNEWQMGALLGDKPEKAYFVKCDRTTMNQNDLDNGRLVCKIGLAVVKPAEFVIFRIGQWTADSKI